MDTAEVVIIGGGVVGCSIAYHLARKGVVGIYLLEKNPLLGSESTGDCVGGIRHQFSTEINIRLSRESSRKFQVFEDEIGTPIDYKGHGYLFLATSPQELKALEERVALQRRLQVKTEMLTPEQTQELVPIINTEDLLGASFCRQDGSADPYLVTQGYVRAARQLGVKVFTEKEVIGIEVKRGKVRGVVTNSGRLSTPLVINAAGPYAARVSRMVGIELPVAPYRRQVFIAQPPGAYPNSLPLVVDLEAEFYFKQEGDRFLLCKKIEEESSFNKNLDWNSLSQVAPTVIHRLPGFEEVPIVGGWAGLRSITPDNHAILGPVPGVEGFICAVGFSGHGFMHAPITGQLIAELVVDGQTSTLDISPLSPERFTHGTLIKEKNIF